MPRPSHAQVRDQHQAPIFAAELDFICEKASWKANPQMTLAESAQSSAVAHFRGLHESGCFVLPNPWDVGTAIYLQHLGFKALATTSAGFAFSKGLPDGASAVSRDVMLEHFREIAAATALPVNADFQNGYADEPDEVATNVKLC